jgi:hypothetical protein
MIEVDGYFVDLGTGKVWIEKRSKRGRHYLSSITSERRIKKAIKLANAKKLWLEKIDANAEASGGSNIGQPNS